MLFFFLGVAAAGAVMNNRRKVVRGLAVTLVTGEKIVLSVGEELVRKATRASEDLQDIVAEARSEYLLERASAAAKTGE